MPRPWLRRGFRLGVVILLIALVGLELTWRRWSYYRDVAAYYASQEHEATRLAAEAQQQLENSGFVRLFLLRERTARSRRSVAAMDQVDLESERLDMQTDMRLRQYMMELRQKAAEHGRTRRYYETRW